MSIKRRDADLAAAFHSYLRFTPTPGDVEDYRADLRRMHPLLLADAVREAREGKALDGAAPRRYRGIIHAIYYRKIKELAALYPLLFAAESALRTGLAEQLETYFETDLWWREIESAMKSAIESGPRSRSARPSDAVAVSTIHGREIWSSLRGSIATMVLEVGGPRLDAAKLKAVPDGRTFLGHATFGQLRHLTINAWRVFQPCFAGDGTDLRGLSKSEAADHLELLRTARNAIYHHNPISERSKVVRSAELICDHLDLHLETCDAEVGRQTYSRPTFQVPAKARHRIPLT